MGMFGPSEGTWWLTSKADPRWNVSGRCGVGGFTMPREARNKLDELKSTLGEPPADLEWGYMKD